MKLLALDLDGTLTNSQKTISPRTLQTLMEAQRQGVRIILASGRPVCGQRHLAEELHLAEHNGYMLAFNGGIVMEYATKRIIDSTTIPHHLLPAIIDMATSHGFDLLSYQSDVMWANNAKNEYIQYAARINRMELREAKELKAALVNPVPKCIIVGEPTRLQVFEEEMKRSLGCELNIVRSEPFFLEVMPQGIDKAKRLELLLQHIGAEREELVACGDGYNDLSMIRYAGIGVAMGNAQQGVKDAADYIAPTNDEDGVADVVERFLL